MLRPFSRFCIMIGAIPESIIHSLSYEQQLLRLIKFLKNTVIPAIDGNTTAIKSIEEWIENVDLQEFVDNKLDEMVESGQLQEIIASYLEVSSLLAFNTVSDMKSGENLVEGSYVRTLGYHSINDGGESTYKIREVTNEDTVDEAFLIALDDENLVAELIYGNIINPIQMGAYGDNTHDDSIALQKGLDALHNRKALIYDLLGKYYLSNTGLHADSMYKCIIRNGYIRSDNFNIDSTDTTKNFILYTTVVENELQDPSSGGYCFEDNTLENITLDCELQDGVGCFGLATFMRININKCDFRRYKTYGVKTSDLVSYDGHELNITDSFFRANFRYETNTTGIGICITKPDCMFNNLVIVGGKYGINVKNAYNYFDNIHIYGASDYALYIESTHNIFNDMYFDGCGVYMYNPWVTTFNNCQWLGTTAFAPITLDKPAGYRLLQGLVFNNCNVRFDNESSQTLFVLPNGNFTINNDENYMNICNFNMLVHVVDNSYLIANDVSHNVASEFTFSESDYVEARTQILKKNGWIYISYQGPSVVHSSDTSIITIPSKYAPLNSNYSIPFITSNTYYGNLYVYNGVIKTGTLSNTTNAGRISFTFAYPYK